MKTKKTQKNEVIYSYNTRLSFGLGANHVSIRSMAGKYRIYNGTPQNIGNGKIIQLDPEEVLEIKGLKQNDPEIADKLIRRFL